MQTYFNNSNICLVGQESVTIEGLQFDLDIIAAATNNFSHENKIGKGGFGEVYKVEEKMLSLISYMFLFCVIMIIINIFRAFLLTEDL